MGAPHPHITCRPGVLGRLPLPILGRWTRVEGWLFCVRTAWRASGTLGRSSGHGGAAWPLGRVEVLGRAMIRSSGSFKPRVLLVQVDLPHSEGPTSLDQELLLPCGCPRPGL